MDFPEFVSQSSGWVKNFNNQAVLIDPRAFFFARAQLEPEAEHIRIIKYWLESQPQGAYFRINDNYPISEETESATKRINILDLSAEQLFNYIKSRAQIREKAPDLFNNSGKDLFYLIEDRYIAHQGEAILSARVKSKRPDMDACFAKVWDPFVQDQGEFGEAMSKVNGTCPAADYSMMKEYSKLFQRHISIICWHTAALLLEAFNQKSLVSHYYSLRKKRGNLDYFIPFNPGRTVHTSEGSHSDEEKDQIMLEAMIERCLKPRKSTDSKWSTISLRLSQFPEIYHPLMMQWIKDGYAGYEVLPETQRPEMSSIIVPFWKALHNYLVDNNFRPEGFVYEFPLTDLETVCPSYENEAGEEVRIFTRKDLPPIFIYRSQIENEKSNIKLLSRNEEHPFSKLYIPFTSEDTRTRKNTFVIYGIPAKVIKQFPFIYHEYAKTINQYLNGGTEESKKRRKECSIELLK